jgi:Trypsin/Domain of unknown function (DUF4384)
VIGREWVLTAAHCAMAMKKADSAASFFIREGAIDLGSPSHHDVAVTEIIAHEKYIPDLYLNDIAVLRLAGPAQSQRQKLASVKRLPNTALERRMSTVVGFGVTQEGGAASAQLRQVEIPVVPKSECQSVYGAQSITDANFCAGEKKGGKDSCQGDSGGPLFVRDTEQLQAGVVSWGKGCARPGYYGVYASVSNFQGWIKAHVRDAEFVEKAESNSIDTQVSNLTNSTTQTDKPGQTAQVTIDIVQGTSVKLKSYIDVNVTSSISGAIVIFAENNDGKAYQLYPSKAFPAPGPDPRVARIDAGKRLTIPSAEQRAQRYRFEIQPPTGPGNRLRALVVPDIKEVEPLISANADGDDIRDLGGVIAKILDVEVDRGAVAVQLPPTNRAAAEVVYEIVQ